MTRKILLSIAVLASLIAACTEDPFDPTGTWTMTARFGAGTCGVTGTVEQDVLVVRAGDQYLASSLVAGDVTTGTVSRSTTSASLHLTITNRDAAHDGGSAMYVVTLDATADENLQITGSGSISLTGSKVCTHAFTLLGDLR